MSWLDENTPFTESGYLNFYNQAPGGGNMVLAAA